MNQMSYFILSSERKWFKLKAIRKERKGRKRREGGKKVYFGKRRK